MANEVNGMRVLHSLNFNFRHALLQHQCIHNGIITENNIIFFRIWRYFSHRASILCLNYIFFLHQHSLCSAACCNPFPPFQLTPCYWLKHITHFLCNLNLLFTYQTYKTCYDCNAWNEWGSCDPLANRATPNLYTLSFIHFLHLLLSLWSLATEHNQLKRKPLWENFPNVLIRWSVQIERRHLEERTTAHCVVDLCN